MFVAQKEIYSLRRVSLSLVNIQDKKHASLSNNGTWKFFVLVLDSQLKSSYPIGFIFILALNFI